MTEEEYCNSTMLKAVRCAQSCIQGDSTEDEEVEKLVLDAYALLIQAELKLIGLVEVE